ncbi:MAG: dicarboxylate/amino acid:cation symporter [Gemmatimonadales bacterium]
MLSSASRVLLALVIGLALGIAAAAAHVPSISASVPVIEVAGTLWINAIRMTVIPLVVAMTIASVAGSSESARIGRIGALAVPVFTLFLLAGGVLALLVTPFALGNLTIPPDVAATLRASATSAAGTASGTVAQMPTLVQRIIDIIPVNPVKAAVDGAILPVVVYSLALGLSLKQLAAEKREPVLELVRAVSDAMLVLVGWILAVAPVGVFALALALGARMGASSVGALLQLVVVQSLVLFVFTLGLYPVATLLGGVSLKRFAAAAAPAQAVAFSSRSSLAALPVMVTSARDVLGLPATTTGFALPLAVSIFRVNVPMAWVVGVYFLGKLYGIPVAGSQLVLLMVTATLISFSVPGIPSGSLFLLAPVLVGNGLPAEGVGILIAVDAIPDMFKTLANVTSHMTSVTLLARVDEQRQQNHG